MENKILCVILARGGSKGIPKKNIFIINNNPLISYSIYAGRNSKYIDKVIVSTDDKKIRRECIRYGAEVPFLRPKKLSEDTTLSVDALKHAVLECEKIYNQKYNCIIELPAVSPFRTSKDVDKALSIFLQNKKLDSLAAYVSTGEKHPIRLKRIRNNKVSDFCKEYPESLSGSRRQDFETSYIRNGSIYITKKDSLFKYNSRNGGVHYAYIMPEERSLNIDNKFDLIVANQLIEDGFCDNKPIPIKENEFFELKKNQSKKKKKKILVTLDLDFLPELKIKLSKKFDCTFIKSNLESDVIKYIEDKEAWICSPTPKYKISKKILYFSKKLKIICTASTGTNHIDLEYCKKNKIKVLSLSGTNFINKIYASSEFTFLALLICLKKFLEGYKMCKSGYWREKENLFRGHELNNQKLGIIGFGRIGKNVARYCKSFGAKVQAYDPYTKNKDLVLKKNIKEVISSSKILIICVKLTKETINLFDKKYFSYIKKGTILINTSRAEIINDDLLIKYLKNKTIEVAFTDVLRYEQSIVKKSKLLIYAKKNKNLIITPHMAGLTFESETKAANYTINNLVKNLN